MDMKPSRLTARTSARAWPPTVAACGSKRTPKRCSPTVRLHAACFLDPGVSGASALNASGVANVPVVT